jgi:hypothetical protein
VLIPLIGPFLGFAGSAFSDHLHYEPLSPIIPFWFSRYDAKMFDSVVRVFGAFKNAVTALKDYYETLKPDPTLDLTRINAQSRYPYPTTFTHLETRASTPLKFEVQPMDDKLLYVASTDSGVDNIIVKFTTRYSEKLHLHCSSLGLAPPLLGYEPLDGRWFMIIMEFMKKYLPLSELDKPRLSNRLKPILLELVRSFHSQNLVHGDLRDTNVLVWEDGEKLEVKLVDFDWGGEAGEVRYPSAINCFDIWRPPGVTDGVLITKEHDIKSIERMFGIF